MDDLSTDDSYPIAQAYVARDLRGRVIRNRHNLGPIGNWNQCVLFARGEWHLEIWKPPRESAIRISFLYKPTD